MRRFLRAAFDKCFTLTAGTSVLLMAAALVIILGPILYRGLGAVCFRATVEWRKLQFYEPLFARGDRQQIDRQVERTEAARAGVYDIMDRFSALLEAEPQIDTVRRLYRQFKTQLRNRQEAGRLTGRQRRLLTRQGRELRDALTEAYEAVDTRVADQRLATVLASDQKEALSDTVLRAYFDLAAQRRGLVGKVSLPWLRANYPNVSDTSDLKAEVERVLKQLRLEVQRQVADGKTTAGEAERMERAAGQVGRALRAAFESLDLDQSLPHLAAVERLRADNPLEASADLKPLAAGLYDMAPAYRRFLEGHDLARVRSRYLPAYLDVKNRIAVMFGPRPGARPEAALAEFSYGTTRWDQARQRLDDLVYETRWQALADNKVRQAVRTPRAETFRGTELAKVFPLLQRDFEKMMAPEFTIYWRYFTDDCTPGHLFGGVGPEIVGTLLLTVLAMVLALPIGVVTAAYLVETAGDNVFVRVVRTCINTLAGVPSIVFGLFGLAFFILWVPANMPWLGMRPESNILAGALTLSVLVLPIVIRASEEAIRSVPATYKEASLSLGAGGLRTFLTVTLSAALPGILTGVILSMSRAAGETAPILFTAAVAWRKGMPESLARGGTRALSYSSYDMAVSDRVAMDAPHNQYGIVMALIVLVLVLNIAAILVRSRVSRRLRGQ